MYGELSEDNCYINMPFEDVHRLVMTMRMAELILNDRVQSNRKDKWLRSKPSWMLTVVTTRQRCWLSTIHRAKDTLTQKHSFRSVGAFEADAYDLEGLIIFETMILTRAIDWIATLSIDPSEEIRRGTITVFSELQSAFTSQHTFQELYFHQHDDKKLLEERVRGAMSDVGERLTRVAVNPSGSVIQKRHNIATELQSVSALVIRRDARDGEAVIQCRAHGVPYGSPRARAHFDHNRVEATDR
jgi:hypothetical protein